MNDVIDKAIKLVIERMENSSFTHDEALKYTQAALNLAQAKITLSNVAKS